MFQVCSFLVFHTKCLLETSVENYYVLLHVDFSAPENGNSLCSKYCHMSTVTYEENVRQNL